MTLWVIIPGPLHMGLHGPKLIPETILFRLIAGACLCGHWQTGL